jgi:2-polyprenyl-3-methyl-5-hydroxy-6-metoxy-1,4-benzoquinol methylase
MEVEISIERFADLRELDGEPPEFVENSRCPICDEADGTDIAVLAGSLATRACHRCGHIYRARRPADEWYRDWYRSGWDSGGVAKAGRLQAVRDAVRMARTARDRDSGVEDVVSFCRPALGRRARVLDVGCGYGVALRALSKQGCKTFGLEPSPRRAQTASMLGANVSAVGVERLTRETFGTTFDLVTSHHVLEHVLDPHEYLERVRDVVEPGGWLYIGVPNADNDFLLQHAFYALHVHLFSRASLELALRRAGLAPQRIAEDHQLRILARREQEDSPEGEGEAAKGPPATERVLARMLGPGFEGRAGRDMYCKWSLLPPGRMAREPYSVEWSADRTPLRDRAIGFRSQGEARLPATFTRRGGNGATPMWVK